MSREAKKQKPYLWCIRKIGGGFAFLIAKRRKVLS